MSLSKQAVPMIDNDKWPKWLTKFKVYVGKKLWTYLDKKEPEIDAEYWLTITGEDGQETPESEAYLKSIQKRQKKWKNNKDKLHQYLMHACSDNPSAFSLAQQHEDDDPHILFEALEKRFLDQSQAALLHHISIFNQLSCGSSETREQFIERVVSYKLTLKHHGHEVTEEVMMERLLNGLKGREQFNTDARMFQLMEDKSWDYITNRLRSLDREDQLRESIKASAHLANVVTAPHAAIICHKCKKPGHKRFNCPQRNKTFKNKAHSSWKKNNFVKNGNNEPPRGNVSQKQIICSLCNKPGHHFKQCRHADAFRKHLSNQKNKGKRQTNLDDDVSLSSTSS
jgi:hypothetical protein